MKNKIIRALKRKIRFLLGIKNTTNFYSQAGEDAIAINSFYYLVPKKNGFYIDIGAYHPFKHSNTYILYKDGWSGINIDPRPGSKILFDKYRKRDINIEAGISDKNDLMQYYIIEEDSTMNSFSKENLERLNMFKNVKRTLEIPVYTLESILAKYPHVSEIDYLNIDAEGFEMQILLGIDFDRTPISIISIEQNKVLTLIDVLNSEANKFLEIKGYVPYAKNLILDTVSTIFYVKMNALP
jgi:FkbM family methyltransferase